MSKFNEKLKKIVCENTDMEADDRYSKKVIQDVSPLLLKNGWKLNPRTKDFEKVIKSARGEKIVWWLTDLSENVDGTYNWEMEDENQESGISHTSSEENVKKEDLADSIERYVKE